MLKDGSRRPPSWFDAKQHLRPEQDCLTRGWAGRAASVRVTVHGSAKRTEQNGVLNAPRLGLCGRMAATLGPRPDRLRAQGESVAESCCKCPSHSVVTAPLFYATGCNCPALFCNRVQ